MMQNSQDVEYHEHNEKIDSEEQMHLEQLSKYLNNLVDNKIKWLKQQQHQSEKRLLILLKTFKMIKDQFNNTIKVILKRIEDGIISMVKNINKQIDSLKESISSPAATKLQDYIKQLKKDQLSDQLFIEQDWNLKETLLSDYLSVIESLNSTEKFNQMSSPIESEQLYQPQKNPRNKQYQEIQDKNQLGQYQMKYEKKGIFDCLAISMNKSENILINGQASNIKVWEFKKDGSLTPKQILKGHAFNINCLHFSKKDNWFISGSYDKQLRIWKSNQNREWSCIQVLEGHKDCINNIVLNKDEDQIISCSDDKTIKVWMQQDDNENKWQCIQTLTEPTNYVYFLSLSPDCDQLASCGRDRLRIWQIEKVNLWRQKEVIENPQDDVFIRACFIDINELIVTTEKIGKLFRFVRNNQGLWKIHQEISLNDSGESDPYIFPIFNNKLLRLAVCRHGSENIYILSKQTNGEFVIHQVLKGDYREKHLSEDGRWLILRDYQYDTMQVWRME